MPDALLDHERLMRQFGAPELFRMYQFDENVLTTNDRKWSGFVGNQPLHGTSDSSAAEGKAARFHEVAHILVVSFAGATPRRRTATSVARPERQRWVWWNRYSIHWTHHRLERCEPAWPPRRRFLTAIRRPP